MSITGKEKVEFSVEALHQNEEERIDALTKLGVSRRRARFIIENGKGSTLGDTVNISDPQHVANPAAEEVS